ncbi:hypothetical protein BEL04_10980 [Mucilaginibacter sp. PPCGB 2223]|uniref:WD40/YVTN/BNR-like repeat-containing protein n=1 Tax=Mucilaginibacter sp. PPCGB 2223 TaxID=1886027 RepID=UPI0008264C91|nr:hypothetical protein [Mucilaginibacter sp. PPCGB 2223]OCX52024.1 hypothetical protein BEL04_10980 [Mucilaginibacter sp. PPCGB 2223]
MKNAVTRPVIYLAILFIVVGLSSCKKTYLADGPLPVTSSPNVPPPDSISGWARLKALNDTITLLEEFNHTIYAASNNNTLYTSADEGVSWATLKVGNISDLSITAIKVFNNKLYVGTDDNGIFSSSDGGKTWANFTSSLLTYNPAGYLVGFAITSFAERNNKLYASTQGNGVYLLNEAANTWSAFNNNLPWIITSYDVFTMINTGNTLVIAAGVNGTFYHYDFDANLWAETLLPKWLTYINAMTLDNGSLYGITTEKKIIRSSDDGITWTYDTADLQATQISSILPQKIYTGTTKNYVLTISTNGKGTWIQQRDRNAAIGTSWATGQELLQGLRINAIIESNHTLFLGTNSGIFIKSIK